ncbi:hypothetical protein [Paenibacillus graminis]|nr:hypothetical protein [Paenibacillus graminis]MEC0170524.1 hypothetical protein [Paenibacillus graminis]
MILELNGQACRKSNQGLSPKGGTWRGLISREKWDWLNMVVSSAYPIGFPMHLSFTTPSMYITDITHSPNKKLVAVVTGSNKSEFVQIINVEEGRTSPELVESARVKYGAQKELDTWVRPDHENYSYADKVVWKDNDTLEFEGFLAYQDTEIIENVTVAYQFSKKVIEVKGINQSR